MPVVARLLGFHVVLADDAGHRALRAWLAQDPDGTPLPALLDRPGDDIWTTQGIPEELAVRLTSAAGGSVTGVDIDELGPEVTAARIALNGPAGPQQVTARLGDGLAVAITTGATVRLADAVMDRLAVPADSAPLPDPVPAPGLPRRPASCHRG